MSIETNKVDQFVQKNMVGDSVGDSLIRIKNGYRALKPEVILPYSKLVLAIAKLLQKEGFIASIKEAKEKNEILVILKYGNESGSSSNKNPALTDVKRISKPGLRIYKGSKKLPWVLNGLGIAIVSTPKGLMTDKQARKASLGGEIMAYVW